MRGGMERRLQFEFLRKHLDGSNAAACSSNSLGVLQFHSTGANPACGGCGAVLTLHTLNLTKCFGGGFDASL
jgi:hypothetical protein